MFAPLPGIGILGILLLTYLAFAQEKHYSQRGTVVANAVIIWVSGLVVAGMPDIFMYWAYGSIIAAIIAGLSYFYKVSLFTELHKLFYYLYSSKTVLAVIIAAIVGFLELSIPLAVVVWYTGIRYFGHSHPFR